METWVNLSDREWSWTSKLYDWKSTWVSALTNNQLSQLGRLLSWTVTIKVGREYDVKLHLLHCAVSYGHTLLIVSRRHQEYADNNSCSRVYSPRVIINGPRNVVVVGLLFSAWPTLVVQTVIFSEHDAKRQPQRVKLSRTVYTEPTGIWHSVVGCADVITSTIAHSIKNVT